MVATLSYIHIKHKKASLGSRDVWALGIIDMTPVRDYDLLNKGKPIKWDLGQRLCRCLALPEVLKAN